MSKNQWEKRVEVFHYVYSTLMSDVKDKDIIKNAFEQFTFSADQMKIIEYYANNKQEIINLISTRLQNNWTWERIFAVTQAILITSYSESQALTIDKKIVIDQALITADKYCEPNEKKFINAILDKIIK